MATSYELVVLVYDPIFGFDSEQEHCNRCNIQERLNKWIMLHGATALCYEK